MSTRGGVVVVVGSGGREHALAWKLAQSERVSRLIVAPGNDGMPEEWERWPLEDFAVFAKRCVREGVGLVVVGPDNPLADGIVDQLQSKGVPCFGPTRSAARLESSKAFAKEVMEAARVPTARYFVTRDCDSLAAELDRREWSAGDRGCVVKADGLALGKGVRVCANRTETLQAARELMPLSGSLVVEEKVSGQEISWMAICDGERCALLDPARDHKRLSDGDIGPNTGGMGAFSPVPDLDPGLESRVKSEVFLPVLAEMKERGAPFRGVLYAGLMVDQNRYWVLEFNARFGDPEAQALLPRLEGDLLDWCGAAARGDLRGLPDRVPFKREAAVVVVAAAHGYPEKPERGAKIQGWPVISGFASGLAFAGGMVRSGDGFSVSGGRVFSVCGMGGDLEQARSQAYALLEKAGFEGMHFRKDIA